MVEIDIFGNPVETKKKPPEPLPVPTEPIDIVIPWVNTQSLSWQEQYQHFKRLELGIASDARNAFGETTFRDFETLPYWFRGIEHSCPWVNKIFLILQDETHVPEWLDVNNPKLRIVYHHEYIPEELLPTFNSMEILCFVPLIKDLSVNYIVANDDTYFLNSIRRDRFFTLDNKPILPDSGIYKKKSYVAGVGCEWGLNIDQAYEIEKKYGNPQIKYGVVHLPMPHNKLDDLEVLQDNWDAIYGSFTISHFRNRKNVNDSTLYVNIARRTGRCFIRKYAYRNCMFFSLRSTRRFDGLEKYDVICINDDNSIDFNDIKRKLHAFFQKKFPQPSSFERTEQ